MKTGEDEQDEYICPSCYDNIGYLDDMLEDDERGCFCSHCGQKIDWNNAFKRSQVIDRRDAFRKHLNLSEKNG